MGDHSGSRVRIEDEFSDNFETFPMELEQPGEQQGERRMSLQPGGRNRREDSLQPSLNEESLFIEEPSPSPALGLGVPGMSIPRRHTMDTAFSLPCHLSSHLQRRLTLVSPGSRSPQASSVPSREKHLLALPSSSLSSMWSLRSRASSPSTPSLKGLPKKLRHSFSRSFSGEHNQPADGGDCQREFKERPSHHSLCLDI